MKLRIKRTTVADDAFAASHAVHPWMTLSNFASPTFTRFNKTSVPSSVRHATQWAVLQYCNCSTQYREIYFARASKRAATAHSMHAADDGKVTPMTILNIGKESKHSTPRRQQRNAHRGDVLVLNEVSTQMWGWSCGLGGGGVLVHALQPLRSAFVRMGVLVHPRIAQVRGASPVLDPRQHNAADVDGRITARKTQHKRGLLNWVFLHAKSALQRGKQVRALASTHTHKPTHPKLETHSTNAHSHTHTHRSLLMVSPQQSHAIILSGPAPPLGPRQWWHILEVPYSKTSTTRCVHAMRCRSAFTGAPRRREPLRCCDAPT